MRCFRWFGDSWEDTWRWWRHDKKWHCDSTVKPYLCAVSDDLEGHLAVMETVESDIVTALWSRSYALFQMICQELGGQLAVIETAAEQNYIEGFLQRFGCESAPLTPLHWPHSTTFKLHRGLYHGMLVCVWIDKQFPSDFFKIFYGLYIRNK